MASSKVTIELDTREAVQYLERIASAYTLQNRTPTEADVERTREVAISIIKLKVVSDAQS